MYSFFKQGGAWCVRSLDPATVPGATVTVTKRNGATSTVTLGDRVAPGVFAIAAAPRVAPATSTVGDLSAVLAMFNRARGHLRYPAVVLDGFRVNVAGRAAREPGSLTVTSPERDGADGRRRWFGRVTLAGQFEPARDVPANIAEGLRAFAADPAGVAAAYGRLHGACCFCRRALRDERSTAVGYGPDCADHYGLPWGSREVAPALPVAAPAPIPPAPRIPSYRGTARSRARAAMRYYNEAARAAPAPRVAINTADTLALVFD